MSHLDRAKEEALREKPEECEGCGYATKRLKFYEARTIKPSAWFCRFCELSNPFDARDEYITVKAISHAGNVILDALEKISRK